MSVNRSLGILLAVALTSSAVLGKAPTSKDVMRPVDTAAGSLMEAERLTGVNLERVVSISISDMPAEIAFERVSSMLGIEWGFMPGVNVKRSIKLDFAGNGRDVLTALGIAAHVRFEAIGPSQVRVFEARPAPSARTPAGSSR